MVRCPGARNLVNDNLGLLRRGLSGLSPQGRSAATTLGLIESVFSKSRLRAAFVLLQTILRTSASDETGVSRLGDIGIALQPGNMGVIHTGFRELDEGIIIL
jgi:hypothetical protein